MCSWVRLTPASAAGMSPRTVRMMLTSSSLLSVRADGCEAVDQRLHVLGELRGSGCDYHLGGISDASCLQHGDCRTDGADDGALVMGLDHEADQLGSAGDHLTRGATRDQQRVGGLVPVSGCSMRNDGIAQAAVGGGLGLGADDLDVVAGLLHPHEWVPEVELLIAVGNEDDDR